MFRSLTQVYFTYSQPISVRGPLPYYVHLHFVGHCPTSISWAIALLPLFSWAIALLLRTLILVFVCCKTRLATFVLRGCDSISLVPYVPGPILATICRSESQLTRVSSSTC